MDSASGMSIGQRIALYRRLRGLTQEGLAMRLHRSKSWVTKVERGERQIDSVTTLRQYGDLDLGWIAADRAMLAGEQSGDDLLVGACAASMTGLIMVQGEPGEAVKLAMDAAASLRHVKESSPQALVVWGTLHLYAAQAAARADDPAECRR